MDITVTFDWSSVLSDNGFSLHQQTKTSCEMCRDLPAAENCILSHRNQWIENCFEQNSVPPYTDYTPGNIRQFY